MREWFVVTNSQNSGNFVNIVGGGSTPLGRWNQ